MEQIDFSITAGSLTVLAFAVNLTVQLTKDIIPLPTKLWTLIVSAVLCVATFFMQAQQPDITTAVSALAGSFVVAYAAMYGFDTLWELWERFKKGENINDNNRKNL